MSRADKRLGGAVRFGVVTRFVLAITGVVVVVVVFGIVVVCAVDALPLAWASICATSGDMLANANVERLGVTAGATAAVVVVEFDVELFVDPNGRELLVVVVVVVVADEILFEIVDDES